MTSTKDVVAPRSEQPKPVSEWIGHTSEKFTTNKAHVGQPTSMSIVGPKELPGRKHFDEPLSKTENWKPTMKTGINPKHYAKDKEGVMNINFKPLPTKDSHERRHIRDAYPSMKGPTNDNLKEGLRPFSIANESHVIANQTGTGEYNQEKVMGQK